MAETLAEINFNDPTYAEGKLALQEYMGALRAGDWEKARLKIANVLYALGGTSMRAQKPTDEDLLYEYQKMKNMQEMIENTVDMYQIASTSERMSDQQYNTATSSMFTSYMNSMETLLSNQLSGVNSAALERAKAEVTADQGARDKALDAHYADLAGMEERLLTQSEISAVAAGAAEDIAEEARSAAQRTDSDTSYGQLSREELALAIYNNVDKGPYRNAHAAQAYGYISDDGVRLDLGIEPRLEADDTPGASSREEMALARLSGWDGTGTAGDHLESAGAATNTVTLVNSGKRLAEARRYDDRLYGNPETGLTRDGNVPSTRRFYGTYLDDASADAAHVALSSWVLTSKNLDATAEERAASFQALQDTLLGSPMGNEQTKKLLDTYTEQVKDLDDLGLPTMLQKRNAWRESDLGEAVLGTAEAAQLGEDTITRQVGRQFMPGLFGKGKIKRGVREDVRESLATDPAEEEEVSEEGDEWRKLGDPIPSMLPTSEVDVTYKESAEPPPEEPPPEEDLPSGLFASGDLDVMDLPPGVRPKPEVKLARRGPVGPGAPIDALSLPPLATEEARLSSVRDLLPSAPRGEQPPEEEDEEVLPVNGDDSWASRQYGYLESSAGDEEDTDEKRSFFNFGRRRQRKQEDLPEELKND